MYISAKVDYAVRALCSLAAADTALTAEALAQSQGLPSKFLESILNDMRRSGLLTSQRGPDGGYRLARPAGVGRRPGQPAVGARRGDHRQHRLG